MSPKRPTPGNNLLDCYPDLSAQWHPVKNGALAPEMLLPSSGKKVWWLCQNGHEWESRIDHRVNGIGCPYCSGKRAIPGVSDLATTHPELAAQWHPTRNGELKPSDIMAGSRQKIWWQCDKGHEWEATANSRTNGRGCPYCANRKVLPGYNDLATTNPALASEWHPTKNGDLLPTDVMSGSKIKVWWQGKCGHEWETMINTRRQGSGCKICGDLKRLDTLHKTLVLQKGSLSDLNPKLAAEWHPTKNGQLLPSQVTVASGKNVWWQCEKGHEWQATIHSRSGGTGCPYCAKEKRLAKHSSNVDA